MNLKDLFEIITKEHRGTLVKEPVEYHKKIIADLHVFKKLITAAYNTSKGIVLKSQTVQTSPEELVSSNRDDALVLCTTEVETLLIAPKDQELLELMSHLDQAIQDKYTIIAPDRKALLKDRPSWVEPFLVVNTTLDTKLRAVKAKKVLAAEEVGEEDVS